MTALELTQLGLLAVFVISAFVVVLTVDFKVLKEHPLSSEMDKEFNRNYRILLTCLVVGGIAMLSCIGISIYVENFLG